jgi:hypothetical protein
MSARARGQAVVELALAAIVLVTVIMAGIFFGEVMFGQLKVTEAATSAIWDLTHYKMHRQAPVWSNDPIDGAVLLTNNNTNTRYQNHDGRTDFAGARTLTKALSQATPIRVRCYRGGGLPVYHPNRLYNLAYDAPRGVSCEAEADFTAIRVPTSLAEGGGGLFQAANWAGRAIKGCSLGRARGGTCQGHFGVMVDDWGLMGASEDGMCVGLPYGVPGCMNNSYYMTTTRAWTTSSLTNLLLWARAGSTLAQAMVQSPLSPMGPIEEWMFNMSFVGENSLTGPFHQLLYVPFMMEGWEAWPTTPYFTPFVITGSFYTASHIARDGCYLGKTCPPP